MSKELKWFIAACVFLAAVVVVLITAVAIEAGKLIK